MSSAAAAFSPRFRRAAAAELERLSARLEGAKRKARERKGELAAAQADAEELEARLVALGSLLDCAASEPAGPPGTLRGRAIREIAVEILVGRLPDAGPIHYRSWLAAVEAEAGPLAGKRPEAVFLGQVTRHPLVRATTRRGFYQLDPAATARLEARVARLRTALADATAAEAGGAAVGRGGQLSLDLGRAERLLAEARAALPARATERDHEFDTGGKVDGDREERDGRPPALRPPPH
ncbi:MAG: hypothetical protein JST59_29685 [Actinobacteria bacterium]|nr:hypothetical protein [Actinomycetota bacterium]